MQTVHSNPGVIIKTKFSEYVQKMGILNVMKWRTRYNFCICSRYKSVRTSVPVLSDFYFKLSQQLKYACLCVVLHLIEWQVTLWQLCLLLILCNFFLNSRCWTKFGTLSKLSRVLVQTSVTVSLTGLMPILLSALYRKTCGSMYLHTHTGQFCSNVIWMKLHTWL